jgi:hypothetical protein
MELERCHICGTFGINNPALYDWILEQLLADRIYPKRWRAELAELEKEEKESSKQ